MVQFNLPQNSKILKGQYFKDKTGSLNLKTLTNAVQTFPPKERIY